MGNILILDIGGTAIKAAVIDKNRNILKREERKTPHTSQQELITQIKDIYKNCSDVEGIGLSMPGIIDSERGYIHTGGSLTYNCDCDFKGLLEECCGKEVYIENDAKCAALAEMWCGSLHNIKNGMVLVLGTGIGGGLIIDGKLVKGTNFSAGEISYLCLEQSRFGQPDAMAGMICSTGGLLEMAKKEMHIEQMDGREFFSKLEKGDKVLDGILEKFCRKIAILVFNLQMTLDLQRISFGGGISRQPRLINKIKEQVHQLFLNEQIRKFSPNLPEPEVVSCKFFNDSNIIGALYHYLRCKEQEK